MSVLDQPPAGPRKRPPPAPEEEGDMAIDPFEFLAEGITGAKGAATGAPPKASPPPPPRSQPPPASADDNDPFQLRPEDELMTPGIPYAESAAPAAADSAPGLLPDQALTSAAADSYSGFASASIGDVSLIPMDDQADPTPAPLAAPELSIPTQAVAPLIAPEKEPKPHGPELPIASSSPAPKSPKSVPPAAPAAPLDGGSAVPDGSSSLLMGADVQTPTARAAVPLPPRPPAAVREKMKVVAPKPGAKAEWFANPEACRTFSRKHGRPLLLYFSTGDMKQCYTYEKAIRMEEMQPFLGMYVCCMIDMRQPPGRECAKHQGVPDDGPAMVLLAPSGREYARLLKPEVDWQFLATMLFWVLQ